MLAILSAIALIVNSGYEKLNSILAYVYSELLAKLMLP